MTVTRYRVIYIHSLQYRKILLNEKRATELLIKNEKVFQTIHNTSFDRDIKHFTTSSETFVR